MHTTYNKMMNNLEVLNLSVFRENLPQYLDMISLGEKSVTDALYELTEKERQFRDEKAIITQIHKSALPSGKSVDGYDFSFQPSLDRRLVEDLATLRFIEGNENILFVGSPGTGKTHLAAAIGTEAARHRYSVYFITCQELMNQLKKAELENRLEARLRAFMRHRLLIIDEIGYLNLDSEDANLFFQLITLRYEKKSTVITTNKSLSKWNEIFGDPVITNAILDRLLHHSHIVNIVGPSYRTKDVLEKLEESRKRNMMPPKLGNFKFPILGKLILPLLSPLESSITVRILSLIFRGRDSTPATGSKSVLLSAASKISHPFYQKQTMPHPAHPAISVSLAKGGSND